MQTLTLTLHAWSSAARATKCSPGVERIGAALQGELKLTMLLTWNSNKCSVQVHVSPLPVRPLPPVKAQVSLRCKYIYQ